MFSTSLMGKSLSKRVKCTILYATETGKSDKFAKSLNDIFNHSFNSKVAVDKYNYYMIFIRLELFQ